MVLFVNYQNLEQSQPEQIQCTSIRKGVPYIHTPTTHKQSQRYICKMYVNMYVCLYVYVTGPTVSSSKSVNSIASVSAWQVINSK